MTTETLVIRLSKAALTTANSRRLPLLILVLLVAGGLTLSGCTAAQTRPEVARPDLLKLRTTGDEQGLAGSEKILQKLLERTKTEYDRRVAAGQKEPAVIDILIISGGGDWGAFGAGFLKGWQKVPAKHPLAKPEFDAVTGVSTGTLIAPFAFLGDERSIDEIANLYRNPGEDWVKNRGFLYFLPDNISFAEVPGLEREMRDHITLDMIRRVAKAGADGRLLAVNTTNLDDASSRVFDLVWEAQRAVDTGKLERIHNIMLAGALFLVTPPVTARLMGHYNLVLVWPLACACAAYVWWWRKPSVRWTRASSSAFITSCSRRRESPAPFRSG